MCRNKNKKKKKKEKSYKTTATNHKPNEEQIAETTNQIKTLP